MSFPVVTFIHTLLLLKFLVVVWVYIGLVSADKQSGCVRSRPDSRTVPSLDHFFLVRPSSLIVLMEINPPLYYRSLHRMHPRSLSVCVTCLLYRSDIYPVSHLLLTLHSLSPHVCQLHSKVFFSFIVIRNQARESEPKDYDIQDIDPAKRRLHLSTYKRVGNGNSSTVSKVLSNQHQDV